MSSLAIHRVMALDLRFDVWPWPFSEQRRAEIDAHFAAAQRANPQLWNGRVLLAREPVFAEGRFSASYFETGFADFLAWRDWGFPDKAVFNAPGAGALRCNDGIFVLGEMAAHTANAGRIYFPSGTPDLSDVEGNVVDIAESIRREVGEETGLAGSDYRSVPEWHCVFAGAVITIVQVLNVDMPGEALRAIIAANLASQRSPELSAMHLVRGVEDCTVAMPSYVAAFIEYASSMPV